MPRFSPLKPKEVERILLKNKFILKRQTGSHRIFYNPKTEKLVVLPFHSKDIPKGTLKSSLNNQIYPKIYFLKDSLQGESL